MRHKIGILGGAFSPITIGHTDLAKFVLSSGYVNEILFIPCFKHVFGKSLPSFQQRFQMCKLALKNEKNVSLSDIEYRKDLPGDTYSLVQALKSSPLYSKVDLFFIIGSDNANTFNNWINYRELEKLVNFMVVERQGMVPDPKIDWYLKDPHIYLRNNGSIPEVSSTEVRQWLKDNKLKSIEKFLNTEVIRYIKNHKLYMEEV